MDSLGDTYSLGLSSSSDFALFHLIVRCGNQEAIPSAVPSYISWTLPGACGCMGICMVYVHMV